MSSDSEGPRRPVPDPVHAPWTEDQVCSLNEYQGCGYAHPFTDGDGSQQVDLIATPDGWVRVEGGPVVQTWAHRFMTDYSWRRFKLFAFEF